MNEFTRTQIEMESELAALSSCRAQLRDLWLKNSSPELLAAMTFILERMHAAEMKLDAAIEARDIEESLGTKTAVPIVRLHFKL